MHRKVALIATSNFMTKFEFQDLQSRAASSGMTLKDGRLKLDNNLAENEIRPITLGRKNNLFCGNHESAENMCDKVVAGYLSESLHQSSSISELRHRGDAWV